MISKIVEVQTHVSCLEKYNHVVQKVTQVVSLYENVVKDRFYCIYGDIRRVAVINLRQRAFAPIAIAQCRFATAVTVNRSLSVDDSLICLFCFCCGGIGLF